VRLSKQRRRITPADGGEPAHSSSMVMRASRRENDW
jgi:hypothetical protein